MTNVKIKYENLILTFNIRILFVIWNWDLIIYGFKIIRVGG